MPCLLVTGTMHTMRDSVRGLCRRILSCNEAVTNVVEL